MDKLKSWAEHLLEKRPEEDFVDRANVSLTPFMLFFGAIIIFAKVFVIGTFRQVFDHLQEYGPVSQPISCWSQAEWNDEWMEYVHEFWYI